MADWLRRLGRRGFEALIDRVVRKSVDGAARDRVEHGLVSIENRLAAAETRLDVSDRIAKLEVGVATLKRKNQGECLSIGDWADDPGWKSRRPQVILHCAQELPRAPIPRRPQGHDGGQTEGCG